MSKGLSSTGYEVKDASEVLTDMKEDFSTRFGPTLVLDETTKEGKIVIGLSDMYADIWKVTEDVYKSFIPSQSKGIALSNVVQFNGASRNLETPTSGQVDIVGVAGLRVPSLRINNTEGNEPYIVTSPFTIGVSGTITVNIEATELGTNIVDANELTVFDTPLTGLTSVTNILATVQGVQSEDDKHLQIRRENIIVNPSSGAPQSVLSSLLNIKNMIDAKVLDNPTEVLDANGLSARGLVCIVKVDPTITATANAIWQNNTINAIFRNRGLGSIMDQDVGTKVNGIIPDIQGIERTITYHPATDVPIYIILNIETNTLFPSTGIEDIKQALVDYSRGDLIVGTKIAIGEDVIHSKLYRAIYSVQGFVARDFFIDTSATPTTSNDIAIVFNAIADFNTTNIAVNII